MKELSQEKEAQLIEFDKSSIDIVLVSADLVQFVEKLLIVEDRKHAITKLTR